MYSVEEHFLRWAEFRVVPRQMFKELEDYNGDAFVHMFACMTFISGGQFSLAAKHLREAIKKDRPTIGRMAEIGAFQMTSMVICKKRLKDVLDTVDLEKVLEEFASGRVGQIESS